VPQKSDDSIFAPCESIIDMVISFKWSRYTQIPDTTHNRTHCGLKASEKVDEERVSRGIDDLEDVLLRHETVYFISRNDVTFLESLDGKVFTTRLVLRENYLLDTITYM